MIDWKYGSGDFLVLYLVAGTALFLQMLWEFCLGPQRRWGERGEAETKKMISD
jgi:hypothetical protein